MSFRHSVALAVCSLLAPLGCGGSQPEAETPASAATTEPPMATPTPPDTASAAAAAGPTAAPDSAAAPPVSTATKNASFDISAKSGSKLAGKVTLTDSGTGVAVLIEVSGISPGKHGAHVHENPDCSATDAKSAGSHYNPDKHPHGLPTAAEHHIGDLGNIEVGSDGKGKLSLTIPDANLNPGDPHSLLGRSIIIHEKLDDGGQPVGNAGGRIGCVELK